jgi:hypothetical protein
MNPLEIRRKTKNNIPKPACRQTGFGILFFVLRLKATP